MGGIGPNQQVLNKDILTFQEIAGAFVEFVEAGFRNGAIDLTPPDLFPAGGLIYNEFIIRRAAGKTAGSGHKNLSDTKQSLGLFRDTPASGAIGGAEEVGWTARGWL